MNLILVKADEFLDSNQITLRGRRATHLIEVLKVKIGDQLEVGQINGLMGEGRVIRVQDRRVDLSVSLKHPPPAGLKVNLILALPRPIVLKRLLMTLSTLGVKKIVLLHSNRVEKSYWSSPVLSEQTIQQQFLLGLEQGKDTIVPELLIKKRFKPFVEDELADLMQGTLPVVAHPDSHQAFSPPTKLPVTLVIGPEGGFVPYEIEHFKKLNFKFYSLGSRILKVETAVCAALSKLCL